MADEKHDAPKTMKIVPDVASLRDIARTKSKEDICNAPIFVQE
jgi:hypothetical protein